MGSASHHLPYHHHHHLPYHQYTTHGPRPLAAWATTPGSFASFPLSSLYYICEKEEGRTDGRQAGEQCRQGSEQADERGRNVYCVLVGGVGGRVDVGAKGCVVVGNS